jgi:shikimate dehydrogenase
MEINTNTSLYAVFGNPVCHSLSPIMHNKAFAYAAHNGIYLAFRVKEIGNAISAARVLDIQGISITLPYKVTVMAFLDKLDDTAERIGAVNTVINREGVLIGYNSDGMGAIRALSEKTPIRGKDIIVIGAGGAARAIGFGIIAHGGNLTVANRSKDKGELLAKDLGVGFCPFSEINKRKCQILINATPLGMFPHTDMMPIRRKDLEKEMVVMDIIYNPFKTRLLKEAEDIGCMTVDGVSMFVYQGAFQFELWTGKEAPLEVMKKVVLDALAGNQC